MYIIGISGLSGSGKSSVTRAVLDRFPGKISYLEHDMYYYAKKDRPVIQNFDHPSALETPKSEQFISFPLAQSLISLLNFLKMEDCSRS